MRRLLLTVTLAIGLIAAPVPAAAHPAVHWGDCPPPVPGTFRHPELRCATVRVPVDYRRPHARTIDITISRVPTAEPGLRRGVILTNPGGPGERGLDLRGRLATWLPAAVLDRYDLVGMDPRGVGSSAPIDCGIDPRTPVDLVLPYPAPDGSISRNVAFARSAAAGCVGNAGDLLRHVTTANTARDLDAVRAALGERRVSYYGQSYGTYLGAVYRSMFPDRVDRMVLDSGVDPRLVWRDQWRTWRDAVPLRLADLTTWVAARDATYHLGTTSDEVTRRYSQLAARLDRVPVTLPDGTVVSGNVLRELTRAYLVDDELFPLLADGWRFLDTGVGSPPPVPAFDGNFIAAFYAIACNDASWPRDPARYARDVAADRRRSPLTAGMPANIWPCAFWPSRTEPTVTVTGGGRRNVLVLQQTRDPATSLTSGAGLRAVLGRAAAMITVDGGGHLVFGRGTCADQATTTYLTTGELPVQDRSC